MPNQDKNREYYQKHGGKTLEESQKLIQDEINDNPVMNAYKWLTKEKQVAKKKKEESED